MKKGLISCGLLLILLMGCESNDSKANPVDSGGNIFPKPGDGTNTTTGTPVVKNKQVQLSYTNNFGTISKTAFVGNDVLAPSCVITKPTPKSAPTQQFLVSIKNNVSSLGLATEQNASPTFDLIYKNLYKMIVNAQDTGAFSASEVSSATLINVSVQLKIVGQALVFQSDDCILKPLGLVKLEEGGDEGDDIIHALTFRATCSRLESSDPGAQPLKNLTADFTCLVSESKEN